MAGEDASSQWRRGTMPTPRSRSSLLALKSQCEQGREPGARVRAKGGVAQFRQRNAMIEIFWEDRIHRIFTMRQADLLRGQKYPVPYKYALRPDDIELLTYLHNEVIVPASADFAGGDHET